MKKELGIGALLLVLCIIVTLKNPAFISLNNLQNNARLIGMFGIFSIGMGMVIITGGIDLSVGSAFALQGILLSMMLREWMFPWPLAVLTAILGMVALGALHGFLVAKVRMQPFVVTMCGLLIYRGLARYIPHDETKGFGAENFGYLRPFVTGKLGPIPMPFVLLIIVTIIMSIVLHWSIYGRYLFAVGRNEDATRYSGINTKLVLGSAYALGMLLAGISGILMAFDTNSIGPSNYGNFYEFYGIAAAVLGGCSLRGGEGSVVGIVLGAALLQVLQNLVNLLGIDSSLNFAVMGGVIFIGALVDQLLNNRRKNTKIVTPAQTPAPAALQSPG